MNDCRLPDAGCFFELNAGQFKTETQRAMKQLHYFGVFLAIACMFECPLAGPAHAESPPQISRVQKIPRGEIALTLTGQPATYYQLQAATNLFSWTDLATFASGAASSLQYTDSAAPFLQTRYYRAQE